MARVVWASDDRSASVVVETTGWVHRHDRDLTGFVGGTENPTAAEAPSIALVPSGSPGEGSSVVLHQLWGHDSDPGTRPPSTSKARAQKAMGRTKGDSTELAKDVMPAHSSAAP